MGNRIGYDIEFVLMKDGVPVPSQGIIPGTKHKPHVTSHGIIHRDNVMAEIGGPPADNEDAFLESITTVINDLKHLLPDGVSYHATPSCHYNIHEATNSEVFEFGCDRDYSAWPMVKPIAHRNPFDSLRSAGGHVHFDLGGRPSKKQAQAFIQVCDYTLGAPSLIFDDDRSRRSLYGHAGCYRIKPYGVEYRTLSNRWAASEEWIRWTYRMASFTVDNYKELSDIILADAGNITSVFNTSLNDDVVKYLTDVIGVELPLERNEVSQWIG